MAVEVDRSLRLPDSEYFAQPQVKTGIALHHTVCDSAKKTLDIWGGDQTPGGSPRRVATAYVIERDGTIYEAFDPACWAWQFGLNWPRRARRAFEKRFIGIEITSEGGLKEYEGRLYAYGVVVPHLAKSKSEALDAGVPYRGYQWFDRYEPEQLESLGRLVDDLCTRFSIPRVYPAQPFLYYGDALMEFEGVIGHAMVRSDKSDPAPDPGLWRTLEAAAGLTPVPVSPSERATRMAAPLTPSRREMLFMMNTVRLDDMDVAAGSLVKTLLQELERRRVYLMLKEPARDGHAVEYSVLQGDAEEVRRLGRALGFKRVTDRVLEVRRA